jgi:hypothetical protein
MQKRVCHYGSISRLSGLDQSRTNGKRDKRKIFFLSFCLFINFFLEMNMTM